jgi:hypothetical protein
MQATIHNVQNNNRYVESNRNILFHVRHIIMLDTNRANQMSSEKK